MINPNITTAYSEAANYTDGAAYISDIALSSMWGEDADLQTTAGIVSVLWDIHTRGIRAIIPDGMSARSFAVSYGIPVRTLEDWCASRRNPPPYVLLLLAHDQGMI